MSSFFLCLLAGLIGLQGTSAFFFFWQTSTSQCGVYSLRWQNGTAPFTASIIPIYGQPFFYDIPPEAYQNNYGEYDIQLQLNAGTSYVVVMSDATGTGAGGSSQIVRVQVSNMTDCLYTAPQNATNLDFTFSVSGIAEQCKRGFELAWSGGREYGPYNFTVVPLDQSFRPYDVALQKGVVSMSDWRLNMTERTRFTVMMNNAQGYGRGGVAGIYEVAAGGDSNCVSQSLAPTGPWPIGLATNTLSPPTLPVTDPAGDKKGLKGGAIAGVVIGVLAFFAILALALLFLLKRKRRRQAAAKRIEEHEVDLADAYDGEDDLRRGQSNVSSHVEPYHRLDPFIGGQSESFEESREGTMTSAGFAGVGAGLVPSRSASGDILEESDRPSGPGVAGPLPSKNQPPSSPSSPTSPGRTLPTRRPLSGTSHSLKNDLLTQSSDTNVTFPPPVVIPNQGINQGISRGRSMRVINPDDPTSLPTLPPGSRVDDRRSRAAGPTYRRHEDAGRVPVRRDREEIVDLPPLYTDVPRDGPEYTTPSDINSSPLDDLNRDRRF